MGSGPLAPARPAAFLCILLQLAAQPEASSFLRAGQVSHQEAEETLSAELAGGIGEERLRQLEQALGATFASLPKDDEGNLGHQAVRYVLHRLFVQRHGWYIKGLDPAGDEAANASSAPAGSAAQRGNEWVANYLQERMEATLGGRGAGLRELASLAAALEDLVRHEATARLSTAYEIHQLDSESDVSEEQMDDVIRTFYTAFLVANNFSAANPDEAHRKKDKFKQIYTGYQEAEAWLAELIGPKTGSQVSFNASSNVAVAIGERYHARNDLECRSLKKTLLGMEGSKQGRVSLGDFYRAGKHSHWRFSERAEYLKLLGALDDSDPERPQVIVPNYVMGRINCLEVSSIYALCCQNECESLMGELEREIGAPEAEPQRLLEIIKRLSTDTVQAPRELPGSLVRRLLQVAQSNGGGVPLHGRLFAQWMHHAFPRECPYPHEAGSTSALTPDEWMEATALSSSASDEEIEKVCSASSVPAGATSVASGSVEELPWSQTEEILVRPRPRAGSQALHSQSLAAALAGGWARVVCGVISGIGLALLGVDASRQSQRDCRTRGELDGVSASSGGGDPFLPCGWPRPLLAWTAATTLAFSLGLLDVTFMFISLCGPLGYKCSQLASVKMAAQTIQRKGFI